MATEMSDSSLRFLSLPHSLRKLSLTLNPITGKGLKSLAGIGRLSELVLYDTEVTDDDIELMGKFSALRILNLGITRVTGNGIDRLSKLLPNCEIQH